MNTEWIIVLILLLPLAAVSGWFAANSSKKNLKRRNLPPEYFKGLNYVLNEQPDKAIEIFVKMLEVDSETVDTHLTLGSLFRRRGEVDRAIRIHQNLIARPTMGSEFRSQAVLELGLDYMKLGILDRAEALFTELVADDNFSFQTYSNLLDIYQQEHEWVKAIATIKKLESISAAKMHPVSAQFYCELAGMELTSKNEKEAKQHLKRALNLDPKCVRASLMEADLAMKANDYQTALKAYRRIEKQDPEYLSEVINHVRHCYQALNQQDKFREYLAEIVENHRGISPLLYMTDVIAESEGDNAAVRFLAEELHKRPSVRGVNHLVKYVINMTEGELRKNMSTIMELTTRLMDESLVYKCRNCGFAAKYLHWQCPGCKNWNSVKPIHGVHGE